MLFSLNQYKVIKHKWLLSDPETVTLGGKITQESSSLALCLGQFLNQLQGISLEMAMKAFFEE